MKRRDRASVVVGIGAGSVTFRSRVWALLFALSYERATGWTSWDYLKPEEQARVVRMRPSPYLYDGRHRRRWAHRPRRFPPGTVR